MTVNSAEEPVRYRDSPASIEQEIGDLLAADLNPPWRIKNEVRPVDVQAGQWEVSYRPDFFIANEMTQQRLAVQISSSISLSIPNILKLHHIQTALEKSGAQLLVLVYQERIDALRANARLGEYGVNAVAIRDAADGVRAIERQLKL